MTSNKKFLVFCIMMASLAMASMGTLEDDEKDCVDQLGNLASCIPYVSGTAKKPTPECCEDTRKVKETKPKCLCVLIKESTDPSMGLPVNTTLALQMPSVCDIDAKVSDCPSILNLPPNSPDAKIFKEAEPDSTTSSTSDTPKTSVSTSSGSTSTTTSSSSGSESKSTPNSNNGAKSKSTMTGTFLVVMMVSVAWISI
ncbi:Bifunctional inhibitor/plant lipid transfer protein/seed storage helical domain containing protein [Trema orientale]|uniref:Bifunctional inhibitor/plant lipid transfer protein/seed storage helical domain containing protein n=1 Tax=Trema orientale TaxID=63057 RepID=A0A2P5AI47_TREOI|nr:Bifunctional inhibitor/plant lipid transfer protein/seed storage helical domain containing protein [Trema orientale]